MAKSNGQIGTLTQSELETLGKVIGEAFAAKMIEYRSNEYWHRMGGKVTAVFGPNYVFTGRLVKETEQTIVLADVVQVYETGDHQSAGGDWEAISEEMIFPKTAICNVGVTSWSRAEKLGKRSKS